MKVAINGCHSQFRLSEKALRFYSVRKVGEDVVEVLRNGLARINGLNTYTDEFRSDPILIEVIEELGEEANGVGASIIIKEIPDDAEWEIEEYDGKESLRKPVFYY